MSRTDKTRSVLRSDPNEGTAARTRPITYKEIMERRKKKRTTEHDAADPTAQSQTEFRNEQSLGHSKKGRNEEGRKSMKSVKKESSKITVVEHSDGKPRYVLRSEISGYVKFSRDEDSERGKHDHDRMRNGEPSRMDIQHDNEAGERRKVKSEVKRKIISSHDGNRRRPHADRSMQKLRDSSRWHDLEPLEWKDHKQDKYHEEFRSRRRRSRSRDNDREKLERSVSPEPRDQREKSRRKHSEADRPKTSRKERHEEGSYRKHSSGLGGYSPRKRKTGSAIKSPSPVKHSPEKKSLTWDQPPMGMDQLNMASLISSLQFPIVTASPFSSSNTTVAMMVGTKPVLEYMAGSKTGPVDPVQLTQATRPMRSLYVEHLPTSVSEKTVIDFFNDSMLSSGVNHLKDTKPCLSCYINKEKGQALVEFLTPEDATMATSFDGRSLSGSHLKIRRPKDYIDKVNDATEKPVEEAKLLPTVVMDSLHKIFVAGIPASISSEMIVEIIGMFGPLRAFWFDHERSFAFFEYMDKSVTLNACAGLNGMKLAGGILTACQAFPDGCDEENDVKVASYDIPAHVKPLLTEPTKVLQLHNVFDPEEFQQLTREDLDEMLEDVRLECGRFGVVKSINFLPFEAVANMQGLCDLPAVVHEQNGIATLDEMTCDHSLSDLEEPAACDPPADLACSASPIAPDKDDKDGTTAANGLEEGLVHEEKVNQNAAIVSGANSAMLPSGCIFVEYVRKEAACTAAHALHGRLYGDRAVCIGYAPHEAYLAVFSR